MTAQGSRESLRGMRAAEAVPRDRMGVFGLKTTREQWSEGYGIRAETFKDRQASRMSPEPTEERREENPAQSLSVHLQGRGPTTLPGLQASR